MNCDLCRVLITAGTAIAIKSVTRPVAVHICQLCALRLAHEIPIRVRGAA